MAYIHEGIHTLSHARSKYLTQLANMSFFEFRRFFRSHSWSVIHTFLNNIWFAFAHARIHADNDLFFRLARCVCQAPRFTPFCIGDGFTPAADTAKTEFKNTAIDTNQHKNGRSSLGQKQPVRSEQQRKGDRWSYPLGSYNWEFECTVTKIISDVRMICAGGGRSIHHINEHKLWHTWSHKWSHQSSPSKVEIKN